MDMGKNKEGYLVLTRRPGEIIRIGNDITIGLLSVWGRMVKIGVNAPRDIVVLRDELYQRNLLEQEASELIFESLVNK